MQLGTYLSRWLSAFSWSRVWGSMMLTLKMKPLSVIFYLRKYVSMLKQSVEKASRQWLGWAMFTVPKWFQNDFSSQSDNFLLKDNDFFLKKNFSSQIPIFNKSNLQSLEKITSKTTFGHSKVIFSYCLSQVPENTKFFLLMFEFGSSKWCISNNTDAGWTIEQCPVLVDILAKGLISHKLTNKLNVSGHIKDLAREKYSLKQGWIGLKTSLHGLGRRETTKNLLLEVQQTHTRIQTIGDIVGDNITLSNKSCSKNQPIPS